MSDKKINDINKLAFKELESLIELSANSSNPLLIQELQKRIDKVVDTFNKDVEKMLKSSFGGYHKQMDRCKDILNSKVMIDNDIDSDFAKKEAASPQFIQSYEEKNRKKL